MRNFNILDALFPRTRQNILAIVLLSPKRRWYHSDLAHRLGVPPSSLQRDLASLAEGCILERMVDGNRAYYQANAAFSLLPELQSLFAKMIGLADQIRAKLKLFEDGTDLAFIFGSVARGERTAHSDVDVLVVGSVGMADLGMADLALPLRAGKNAPDLYQCHALHPSGVSGKMASGESLSAHGFARQQNLFERGGR